MESLPVADKAMAHFGLTYMAYIRPVTVGEQLGYGVFAADGTQLAVFATEEAAYVTAKQHDLQPMPVH